MGQKIKQAMANQTKNKNEPDITDPPANSRPNQHMRNNNHKKPGLYQNRSFFLLFLSNKKERIKYTTKMTIRLIRSDVN